MNVIESPYDEEQLIKNLRGEAKAQAFMNNWYLEQGYIIISRNGNTKRDLILSRDGYQFRTEEKFRSKDYGDLLIETMQCMMTCDLGWFYTEKFDRLSYVICNEEWIPNKVYWIKWEDFKNWWFDYLKTNKYVRGIISPKGIGLTLNLSVPWKDIPGNICDYYSITPTRNEHKQPSLFEIAPVPQERV